MKRLVFILTAICAAISVMAQYRESYGSSEKVTFITDSADGIPTEVYQVTSEPPQFYGGMGALDKFIKENFNYPAEAWNDTVRRMHDIFSGYFIIRKDGQMVFPRPTIMPPSLADEVTRVVSLLPSWKPAKKDGKVVDAVLSMPLSVLDDYFALPYSCIPLIKEARAAAGSIGNKYKFGISKAQVDSVSERIFSVYEKGWGEVESTLTGARLLAMLGRYSDATDMLSRELKRYHKMGFTKDSVMIHLSPERFYQPRTELHAAITLAAIYDMDGKKYKAREAYDNAIWLIGAMAKQGIRDNGTDMQQTEHYYDLMQEKVAIARNKRGASVRLNPSDRYDIGYEPMLGDANREVEQRVSEGKISDARVFQINRQMEKMNFDRSNGKSVRDAFRLYKICAMLTGLRDGIEAEREFVSEVSGGEVGKKLAKRFTEWSKELSLPVASHKEMLENIVFYAPLNVSGTENEKDQAAAKAFYDKRKQIEEVYPLGWLKK